jgi:hypothetical protein
VHKVAGASRAGMPAVQAVPGGAGAVNLIKSLTRPIATH